MRKLVFALVAAVAVWDPIASAHEVSEEDMARCAADALILELASKVRDAHHSADDAVQAITPLWRRDGEQVGAEDDRVKRLVMLAYGEKVFRQFSDRKFVEKLTESCVTTARFDPFNWNGKIPPGHAR
jgi:hypothetical protein